MNERSSTGYSNHIIQSLIKLDKVVHAKYMLDRKVVHVN